MRIRDLVRLRNNILRAKEKIDKMNEKYPKLYVEELNRIGNSVINKWYATYSPYVYHREYSLYDSFKVILNGTNYKVEFGSDLINEYKHHERNGRNYNEYIYDLTFGEGYHGGAKEGKNHPMPGTPWWRTPPGEFTSWGRPAIRSFSPYYRMVYLMNKKIAEIDKEKQKEFDSIIEKLEKQIDRVIK